MAGLLIMFFAKARSGSVYLAMFKSLYFVKINLMMKVDRITDPNLLKLKQFNESKVCYSYIIIITFIP